jgi:hypothetical protein
MRGKRPPSNRQSDPQPNRCKHVECYARSSGFNEGRRWDECVRDRSNLSRHFRDASAGQRAINANPWNYGKTSCDAYAAAE